MLDRSRRLRSYWMDCQSWSIVDMIQQGLLSVMEPEETEVIKAKGRLKVLAEKTNNGTAVPGTCGIGHTRWATHGEPSENNAHPHMSDDGNVVAVHNGIIENYQELKNKLLRKGYTFYSETDTEVAVKLIDYYYKKYEGTPVDAINHSLVRIRGSYALAVMFKDYPEEIYVARKDSPMILGVGDGEFYCIRCAGYFEIYKKCILYWQPGDGKGQQRGNYLLQSGRRRDPEKNENC